MNVSAIFLVSAVLCGLQAAAPISCATLQTSPPSQGTWRRFGFGFGFGGNDKSGRADGEDEADGRATQPGSNPSRVVVDRLDSEIGDPRRDSWQAAPPVPRSPIRSDPERPFGSAESSRNSSEFAERFERSVDEPDLLASLAEATVHPIVQAERLLRNLQHFLLNTAEATASRLIALCWTFLSTEAIPWLHDFLDGVAASNELPPAIRTAIDDFDTLYDILEMLGFIRPANGRS